MADELKAAIDSIMANMSDVQKNLVQAQASLVATKLENAKWDAALAEKKKDHGRLIGELEAKRTTADAAAAEAKARVDLNNQQAAELMRFKDEIKDREVKVAQREADVGKVARALVDKETALIAREHDIDTNEKDMARRRAKLHEALGLMALLSVWEFSEIVARGGVLIGRAPGVLQQPPVSIVGVSQQSQPFNAATAYIRLNCDTACCIAIGQNPVAVQPGVGRMATNQTEYFGVNPGDKVAVIATT